MFWDSKGQHMWHHRIAQLKQAERDAWDKLQVSILDDFGAAVDEYNKAWDQWTMARMQRADFRAHTPRQHAAQAYLENLVDEMIQ